MELESKLPQFTGPVTPEVRMSQAWKIITEIADGLKFIHSQGQIHRDMKPRNSKVYKRAIADWQFYSVWGKTAGRLPISGYLFQEHLNEHKQHTMPEEQIGIGLRN